MALILKLCWFTSVWFLVSATDVTGDDVKDDGRLHFYHIPNPFKNSENGFYFIKSHQTVVTRQNKKTTMEVIEYFSLTKGFSYSIYRDVDGGGEYALASDGKQDKSYIIHNPSEKDNRKLVCELDAVHTHRQIFPWQFNYDLALNETTKDDGSFSSKKRKKTNKSVWSTKRSVYGVGAIWLNAIELGVVSDQVGEKSAYLDTQSWVVKNYDLTVELFFEKPKESNISIDAMQAAIDGTKLASVQLKRFLAPDTYYYGGTIKGASAYEVIQIDEFVASSNMADYAVKRINLQLKYCRRANQKHRVFPSLMRAMSLSRNHMYELDYIETRFGTVASTKADNKYRNVRNPELIFEVFSVAHESQVMYYQAVHNKSEGSFDDRVDTYLKKFTERASGLWSTRHAGVQYHIVRQPGKPYTCVDNEPDPPPLWFKLMLRPFVFWRPNNVELTGVVTGLGPLLMNANDIHYKQFNLLQKTIEVVVDAADINTTVKVKVDEWRLVEQGGKRVHFYFRQPRTPSDGYELTNLVRVEVREIKEEENDAVVEDASVDDLNDKDLLIRWDILGFHVDNSDEFLNYFFDKPAFCPQFETPLEEDTDKSMQPDNVEDSVTLPPYLEGNEYSGSPDLIDFDEEQDNNDGRKQGEDFEFEPGMSNEGPQMPDFFEQFLGARVSYTAVSKVELSYTNSRSAPIYLKESVNMDDNIARISVFHGSYDEEATPAFEYYLNYKSGLLLKIQGNNCSLVDKLDSELRLFSVDLANSKRNPAQKVTEETHKLRLYGVGALWRSASVSGDTRFVAQSMVSTDEDGSKYRRLYWKGVHDGDTNMPVLYEFRVNLTDEHKRIEDSISLKSIQFDNFFPASYYESSWESVKLTLVKFFRAFLQNVSVPKICEPALADLAKPSFEKSALPTLEEYLGASTGYKAQYRVIRATQDTGLHLEQFTESYDLEARKGKIVSGSGSLSREVYVDGVNKCIYLFAKNTCKLVSTVAAFNTGLDRFDYHHNSGESSFFGLANIWQIATTVGTPTRKTFYDYDKYGCQIRRSFYFITVKSDKKIVKIRFEFTLNDVNELVLNKIEISEAMLSEKSASERISSTEIEVLSMEKTTIQELDYKLPEECSGLCGSDTSGTTQASAKSMSLNELPDLTKIIEPLGKFYMRSEVVLPRQFSGLNGKSNNYHMIDEWYLNGDYRVKSYALSKSGDDIVYTASEEQFDISEEYMCVSKHEISNDSQRVLPPLLKLWKGYVELPISLLDYHLAPASIWRLAEANKNWLKMINYIDLTPIGGTTEERHKALELEMGTRVWQLSHPDGYWTVDLEFTREIFVDYTTGQRVEFLVLSGITVNQQDGSKEVKIEIDVVNYEYNKSDEELQQKLLLPEGYGCQRSLKKIESLSAVLESIQMFQTLAHSIWYETSLEKIELLDNEYGFIPTKTKSVLPTITGTFYKSSKPIIQPYVNIWSDSHTIRYSNGTIQSIKTVHDTLNGIHYEIDRTTEDCETSLNANHWTIRYPAANDDGSAETLELNENMFNQLFLGMGAFQPLNRYERRGRVYITYEETGENLTLTSGLSGHYSIIRQFEHPTSSENYQVKRFESMLVKVFMFDNHKIAKKAILTFNLRRIGNVPFIQVLEALDVSACANNGDQYTENPIRTFTFEYTCNKKGNLVVNRPTTSMKDSFSSTFILETGIYATQMVGPVTLDTSDAESIKFTVNLINAPTFINLDVKHYPNMRMSAEHESIAQVKLTENLMECSRLCDQLKCFSMSYCSNHFCYTVTRKDIKNNSTVLVDSTSPDTECDYYYLKPRNPPTVNSLAETFEGFKSDEAKVKTFPLWTNGDCGMLYPTRVTELTQPLDSRESTGMLKQFVGSRYNEIARHKTLDLSKLDELQAKGFEHTVENVESASQCMKQCEKQGCLMVSICNNQLVKCVIVTGNGNVQELAKAVGNDTQEGCMVMARDYTSEFKRFTETTKPTSWALEYQGFSDKECAAACVLSDANPNQRCLSFDYCLSSSPGRISQATCFIQTTHIYSQEFERTIFEATNQLVDQDRTMYLCEHFSRNFLADYQKLPNRRLKVKYSQVEEGIEADRCAYDCNEDDYCYAFVHCQAGKGGICLILRNNDEKQFQSKIAALKYLGQESRESKTCSIYVSNTYFGNSYLSGLREGALLDSDINFGVVKFLSRATIYLHLALIGGIVIRVIILRFR